MTKDTEDLKDPETSSEVPETQGVDLNNLTNEEKLVQLKAVAYDHVVQINQLQSKLNEINGIIAELLQHMES
jgi:hypothetical protein